MWEALPGLAEKLVSHGRLPLALFLTCAWAVLLNYAGSPLNFDDNITYFLLGLVFSGALVITQLAVWACNKVTSYLAWHRNIKTQRLRQKEERDAVTVKEQEERAGILELLQVLSDSQAITLHYARATNQQRFQAPEWDEPLWSLHMMKLVRKGVDTERGNSLWEIPDFVWNALALDEMPDALRNKLKSLEAPWVSRRRKDSHGHRI